MSIVGRLGPVKHTGIMTGIAPIDRSKLVRNPCVIEHFRSVFVLLYLCIVCRFGMSVMRLRQISSLFSLHLQSVVLISSIVPVLHYLSFHTNDRLVESFVLQSGSNKTEIVYSEITAKISYKHNYNR